ncbi:hypothetical protein SAMN02745245_00323 [Anaerosphaera aminiphila DSM 21120]|uniref:Uncharacterized protein n=1 Tax=Anaerosphaera aminiphila DSM 21120 TaxID=1120995 RepID=A0A1M5PH52_9FIRM|nr:hypothetical protein [Anaerosphaera aminiphila]SHH01041.1 hypothetical protein SAMN02745245_00323 [Anaerosphaera aminiphila DSM 21120]
MKKIIITISILLSILLMGLKTINNPHNTDSINIEPIPKEKSLENNNPTTNNGYVEKREFCRF